MNEKVRDVNRNIDQIKEALYLVEIHFRGFSRTVSLSWRDLGFSGDKLNKIKETKFRLKGVPIFANLAEKAKDLTSLKTEWEYKRTILVDGQKMVTQSQFEPCLQDIAHMKELADRFREELIQEKEQGLIAIREKVTKLLSQFEVSESEINTKLLAIERDFPSDDEISNMLRIETKYIRIKGLIQQLQEQVEVEEALNKQLEIDALRELRASKEQQIKQLIKLKDNIFKSAEMTVLAILSEQLERCNKLEVGLNNKCLRNRIEKHLDKLNALMDLDLSGSFNKVKNNLEQLHLFLDDSAGSNPDLRRKLETQFSEIQKKLEDSHSSILQLDRKVERIKTRKLLVG